MIWTTKIGNWVENKRRREGVGGKGKEDLCKRGNLLG